MKKNNKPSLLDRNDPPTLKEYIVESRNNKKIKNEKNRQRESSTPYISEDQCSSVVPKRSEKHVIPLICQDPIMGSIGMPGPPGRQGLQGPQGSGLQGAQGLGLQGAQGLGLQGAQGSQGLGLQGVQGDKGEKGDSGGAQGFQGFQGQDGFGLQGVQGLQGFQGLDGFGLQGVQGFQGFQGLDGLGLQGFQGFQGFQGLDGLQGLQGFQGLDGLQGFQGTQGSQCDLVCWDENCGINSLVEYSQFTPKSVSADVGAVIQPRGKGYISANIPNDLASGGNNRGTYATDWQRHRSTNNRVASGDYATIPGGFNNSATGSYSYAEGFNTDSTGQATHSGGFADFESNIIATGAGSHSSGYAINSGTIQSIGNGSHAEGYAETGNITANGRGSYSGGVVGISAAVPAQINADGDGSHAEGFAVTGLISASGFGSYAHGRIGGSLLADTITASGNGSHAMGVVGAFGGKIIASGQASHAEGFVDLAEQTNATGLATFSFGRDVKNANAYSMILGQHGTAKSSSSGIQGSGFQGIGLQGATIMGEGSLQIAGGIDVGEVNGISVVIGTSMTGHIPHGGGIANFWYTSGADYAEFFEWADGNSNNEARIGKFVCFDSEQPDKIIIANNSDNIVGVVSSVNSDSGFIGDTAELSWASANLKDEFGRVLYKYSFSENIINVLNKYKIDITDELLKLIKDNDPNETVNHDEGNPGLKGKFDALINLISQFKLRKSKKLISLKTDLVSEELLILTPEELTNLLIDLNNVTFQKVIINNPNYDSTKQYIPRTSRQEWVPIALMGKIKVRDNGLCKPGQKCDCLNGIAVPGSKWRVMNRVSDKVIRILLLNN